MCVSAWSAAGERFGAADGALELDLNLHVDNNHADVVHATLEPGPGGCVHPPPSSPFFSQ